MNLAVLLCMQLENLYLEILPNTTDIFPPRQIWSQNMCRQASPTLLYLVNLVNERNKPICSIQLSTQNYIWPNEKNFSFQVLLF